LAAGTDADARGYFGGSAAGWAGGVSGGGGGVGAENILAMASVLLFVFCSGRAG